MSAFPRQTTQLCFGVVEVSILFACQDIPPAPWISVLAKEIPDTEIHVWPDFGDPTSIEFALIWGPYAAEMSRFPNLKAMISLGAGVDHILEQVDRPNDVPIVRLIDPGLQNGMTEYVLYHVLRYHRDVPAYEVQQEKGLWRELTQTLPSERCIGILGLGAIGTACAESLVGLGFDVIGWSRTKKTVSNVGCFYGSATLNAFIAQSQILICLLPLTPDTKGILNKKNLSELPAGAYLINVGRGAHLIEADLLELLDNGHISAATLDVFQNEPLEKGHPFWTHPKVTVTPHIAALTLPKSAGPVIADIINCIRSGRAFRGKVDAALGY